jgi:hypothetical protein
LHYEDRYVVLKHSFVVLEPPFRSNVIGHCDIKSFILQSFRYVLLALLTYMYSTNQSCLPIVQQLNRRGDEDGGGRLEEVMVGGEVKRAEW